MFEQNRGRILIVDDELDLLELMATNLSVAGYSVDATLDYLRCGELVEKDDLVAVVCDLTLLNGGSATAIWQLFGQSLTERRIAFLIITGHAPDLLGDLLTTAPGVGLLSKPFSLKMLRLRLAELIERLRGSS